MGSNRSRTHPAHQAARWRLTTSLATRRPGVPFLFCRTRRFGGRSEIRMQIRTIHSRYKSTGTITRLPQFEEEEDSATREALTDEEIYARRKPPTSIVIRYGSMRLVAEFPYDGPSKPGCGSKLVVRTSRGMEIGEMLTTTCPNSGCGKSVSREQLLDYIDQSGGHQYPFRTDGKILRVASVEDLNRWSAIQSEARAAKATISAAISSVGLSEQMTLIDVEPTLSQEVLTIYYSSEDRVDFRSLVQDLAREFSCRIEMRQVGARDEARLVADYERCGQHCCCQNFLKVLKPVSMRSAKVQKATLDPLKISGRCGRLMCCLRYEDETYSELKARLPHRKSRVGTPEGPGMVVDSKILVQLVLVKLEADGRQIAVPVEDLCDPEESLELMKKAHFDPLRGMPAEALEPTTRSSSGKRSRQGKKGKKGKKGKDAQQDAYRAASRAESSEAGAAAGSDALAPGEKPKKKRRRRRRKSSSEASGHAGPAASGAEASGDSPSSGASGSEPTKKKRRRRRRRKSSGGDSGGTDGTAPPPSSS